MALPYGSDPIANHLPIRSAQVCVLLKPLLVPFYKVRKSLFKKRKEHLLRRGHQEQQPSSEIARSRLLRRDRQPIQTLLAVGDQRHYRIGENTYADAGA